MSSEDNISTLEEQEDEDENSKVFKIFLYGGNSYHGKAIIRNLKPQSNDSDPPVKEKKASSEEESDAEEDAASNEEILNQRNYHITSCLDPCIPSLFKEAPFIDSFIELGSPEFEATLLEQDIIIYDTNFYVKGVNDAFDAVKILEKWALDEKQTKIQKKKFVLISNLMTWAATQTDELLSDKDYRKRRPHLCYRRYVRLEQEVTNLQTKYKDKIATLILCPGITFGYEEDILHYFFKVALYNKEEIEIFEPGNNDIPLIHVTDLAKIVKRIIESPFKKKYLLAFNPDIKYQQFVLEVAKMITGLDDIRLRVCPKERMLLIDHHLLTQRSFDKLSFNVKMISSNFDEFEFEQDLNTIVKQTVQEYFDANSIKPVKILIHGPPSCGKTTLAKACACHYMAHYIHPDEILEETMIRLEKNIKKGQDYVESMTKYEVLNNNELFKEMLDKTNENLEKWDAELKIIQNACVSKDDDSINQLKEKYLSDRLHSNACTKNQGYVLDTLFLDIESVKRIFLSEIKDDSDANEEGSEADSDEEEKVAKSVDKKKDDDEVSDGAEGEEEGEDEAEKGISINKAVGPDIFIYLKWNKTILEKEEKDNCDAYKDSDHSSCSTSTCSMFESSSHSMMSSDCDPYRPFPDDHDIDKLLLNEGIKKAVETHEKKRLEDFLETEYEDKSLYVFMLEYGVVPFEVEMDGECSIDKIYCQVRKKLGPRNDYLISDQKKEEEKQIRAEKKRRLKEEKEAKIKAQIEAKRREREKQLEKEFAKIIELKRKELSEIEACSLPLRNYLMKYIVPKLTEALVEVARVRPQDPIDYLAEYLFRNNPEGRMFDPCLSDKMAKKILEERLEEIGDGEDECSYCQCLFEEEENTSVMTELNSNVSTNNVS